MLCIAHVLVLTQDQNRQVEVVVGEVAWEDEEIDSCEKKNADDSQH
jgi:hypothetical protein